MANEKILDMTKSAAVNETAVNEKFEELSQQGGGGGVEPATIVNGKYESYEAVGDNLDVPSTPAKFIEDYNTLRLMKDIAGSRVNISGEYGHEPNMVYDNGYIYLAYMYQATGTAEGQANGLSKVRLAKINVSDMSIVGSQVIVAEAGDAITVGGASKTLNSAGSPNIAIINGTIRIWIVAWLTDTDARAGYGNHPDVIAYRDYNTSLVAQTSLTVCEFINQNGDKYELTFNNYRSHLENAGDVIQAHCQYAHINDKYYIAILNGTSGNNGHIFTTTDFKTFTWFAKPEIPAASTALGLQDGKLGLQYEMAVYPWANAVGEVLLYLAIRLTPSLKKMVVAAMYTGLKYVNGQYVEDTNHTAGTIQNNYYGYKIIPCNSNRPCFFAAASNDFASSSIAYTLFLSYDNVAQAYSKREYTDIICMRQSTFESNVLRKAQCLRMTYPSFLYIDGEYYVAYQGKVSGSQPHVFLSKFRPFTANFDKVVEVLNKVLDTFEPSES